MFLYLIFFLINISAVFFVPELNINDGKIKELTESAEQISEKVAIAIKAGVKISEEVEKDIEVEVKINEEVKEDIEVVKVFYKLRIENEDFLISDQNINVVYRKILDVILKLTEKTDNLFVEEIKSFYIYVLSIIQNAKAGFLYEEQKLKVPNVLLNAINMLVKNEVLSEGYFDFFHLIFNYIKSLNLPCQSYSSDIFEKPSYVSNHEEALNYLETELEDCDDKEKLLNILDLEKDLEVWVNCFIQVSTTSLFVYKESKMISKSLLYILYSNSTKENFLYNFAKSLALAEKDKDNYEEDNFNFIQNFKSNNEYFESVFVHGYSELAEKSVPSEQNSNVSYQFGQHFTSGVCSSETSSGGNSSPFRLQN